MIARIPVRQRAAPFCGPGTMGGLDFRAPLPPPGGLDLWMAWPAARIPETRTMLDGSMLREVALNFDLRGSDRPTARDPLPRGSRRVVSGLQGNVRPLPIRDYKRAPA